MAGRRRGTVEAPANRDKARGDGEVSGILFQYRPQWAPWLSDVRPRRAATDTSERGGPALSNKVRYSSGVWCRSKICLQRWNERDGYGSGSGSQEIKPVCSFPSLQSNGEPRRGDEYLRGRVAAAWIIGRQDIVHQQDGPLRSKTLRAQVWRCGPHPPAKDSRALRITG